jgi:uncharacterized protein (DUF362 family)
MSDCGGSRRQFLKNAVFGGLATAASFSLGRIGLAQVTTAPAARTLGPATAPAPAPRAQVGLTTGDDRADMTLRALRFLEKDIARAIGNRRVVIKPNNVSDSNQLASSHVQTLEAVCDFLQSIGKLQNAVIAESVAIGQTMTAFDNYGYLRLAGKYGVGLVDLDSLPVELIHVLNDRNRQPVPARMCKLLMDPGTFVISCAKLKTHDQALATLSLKNVVLAAPIKDPGVNNPFNRERAGGRSDKPLLHGGSFFGLHYNLFSLAPRLHPHLAVIDGFEGMEGNGPLDGTPVDHRVCVASLDWVAADRVGVELMGIDPARVGYLRFSADAGLGQGDLAKIDVLGERVADHIKRYQLHRSSQRGSLTWDTPLPRPT